MLRSSGGFSIETNERSVPVEKVIIRLMRKTTKEKAENIKQISRIVFRKIGGRIVKIIIVYR